MKKLKFKYILPLLLVLVLVLGSCMTVCAASYVAYEDLVFPDTYKDLGYNYYFQFNTNNYCLLTCDSPVWVKVSDSFNRQCLYSDCSQYIYYWVSSDGTFGSASTGTSYISHTNYAFISFIYASSDVYNEYDGTLFFGAPLARLAVPLKAEVQKQIMTILPTAVFCLALLIGSVVLLPRLRKSLLRL